MKKAVQFGAGNIGRGFLGQLLYESGFETVYVDVDEDLIAELNRRHSYPLRLVSADGSIANSTVGNVRAVSGKDVDAVAAEFSNADIAGTSVGVKVLPHIAAAIARGIGARASRHAGPLNILLCENQWHAATHLRSHLDPLLDEAVAEYADTNIGLVETVIGRMVPAPTAESRAEDPLLVLAEPYKQLPISRAQTVGTMPIIVGVDPSDRFEAFEARKLYLHNAAHAALAYIGYGKHEYIWQCALDPEITDVCRRHFGNHPKRLFANMDLILSTFVILPMISSCDLRTERLAIRSSESRPILCGNCARKTDSLAQQVYASNMA